MTWLMFVPLVGVRIVQKVFSNNYALLQYGSRKDRNDRIALFPNISNAVKAYEKQKISLN